MTRFYRVPLDFDWSTLDGLEGLEDDSLVRALPVPSLLPRELAEAISRRRRVLSLALGAITLPVMTVVLSANRQHLSLDDVLLLYLVTVLAITMVGGFWPALLAAIAASLIVNWFFTPPLHTFTIDAPQNLFALLLFVTVAVTVSSVVHLAARRAALAGQAEVLAAGNRLRTALLTAVSHELRTPLAAVKASVSSLRQTDVQWSEDDQAELLATIEENADRLDELIANLLDMSRIQTGSLQPMLRPTSVEEIAPLAAHGLDGEKIDFDIPDDLPLIATDPGLLERAIANLIGNAVRYCPPGIPTQLVARSEDGHVRLDVVDHGPGVRPDMKERMFEPFQQLGDQRSADGAGRYLDGVGLGLAVARGFVEAIGGSLVALDTPGGGLTMRMTLQVACQAP
ncbi:MAG TPA: DUF4118 domain-containing protein [Mycobacteriales bacterium]|nr:DUF4118 domain-containing protein [Mycobacteriales bacterium]